MGAGEHSNLGKLASVPIEVLLKFCDWLDVKSTIRLAESSRTLHSFVLSSRSLWLSQVRRILWDEQIPETVLELLEIDLSALIKCATRKSRLLSLISSRQKLASFSRLVPYSVSFSNPVRPMLQSPTSEPQGWFYTDPLFHLLPGGRWILTLIRAGPVWSLFCWDLLQAVASPTKHLQIPSASYQWDFKNLQRISVLRCVWDAQEESYIILVKHHYGGQAHYVYETMSLTCQPSQGDNHQCFKSISTYNDTSRTPTFSTLLRSHVLIQSPSKVTLWNWRRDSVLHATSLASPASALSIKGLRYLLKASGEMICVSASFESPCIRISFTPLLPGKLSFGDRPISTTVDIHFGAVWKPAFFLNLLPPINQSDGLIITFSICTLEDVSYAYLRLPHAGPPVLLHVCSQGRPCKGDISESSDALLYSNNWSVLASTPCHISDRANKSYLPPLPRSFDKDMAKRSFREATANDDCMFSMGTDTHHAFMGFPELPQWNGRTLSATAAFDARSGTFVHGISGQQRHAMDLCILKYD
ncbi:hypothetical protein DL93DRAFT_2168038 [Clavulina sp. PMI_390]|nr:hypothetical protein DL93DRAFT_2168038 [Clavulina sp. PMI_390]